MNQIKRECFTEFKGDAKKKVLEKGILTNKRFDDTPSCNTIKRKMLADAKKEVKPSML